MHFSDSLDFSFKNHGWQFGVITPRESQMKTAYSLHKFKLKKFHMFLCHLKFHQKQYKSYIQKVLKSCLKDIDNQKMNKKKTIKQLADQSKSLTDISVTPEISAAAALKFTNLLMDIGISSGLKRVYFKGGMGCRK